MKVLNYFNTLKIDKMLGIHRGYAFTRHKTEAKSPKNTLQTKKNL